MPDTIDTPTTALPPTIDPKNAALKAKREAAAKRLPGVLTGPAEPPTAEPPTVASAPAAPEPSTEFDYTTGIGTVAPAPAKPASTIRPKSPITRVIQRGWVLDPDATIKVLVDNPKMAGTGTHGRWTASLPPKGGTIQLKDAYATGYRIGDARYDAERMFIDFVDHTPKFIEMKK